MSLDYLKHIKKRCDDFQEGLSCLTSLTHLEFSKPEDCELIDYSFLSHMKRLSSLIFHGYLDVDSVKNITKQICFCSDLNFLDLDHSFHRYNLDFLKVLKNLKHLGRFYNIDQYQEYEHLQLFNQIVNLETIDIALTCEATKVPILLGKWIQHLHIERRVFTGEDVISILNLPHLKSITLGQCEMSFVQINKLFSGLSARLENFHLVEGTSTRFNKSFQLSLSPCINLKSITIQSHFQYYQGPKYIDSYKDFKIPSSVFPKLESFKIDLNL
jgi:hypothetical protein